MQTSKMNNVIKNKIKIQLISENQMCKIPWYLLERLQSTESTKIFYRKISCNYFTLLILKLKNSLTIKVTQ